jgi:hypothetical protein
MDMHHDAGRVEISSSVAAISTDAMALNFSNIGRREIDRRGATNSFMVLSRSQLNVERGYTNSPLGLNGRTRVRVRAHSGTFQIRNWDSESDSSPSKPILATPAVLWPQEVSKSQACSRTVQASLESPDYIPLFK